MSDTCLILAGDIGGTKTNLAIFSAEQGKLAEVEKDTYPSKDFSGLEPVLKEFLAGRDFAIERACFGVAGPVIDGRVETPNLPWVVVAEKIAKALEIDSVSLLNDLEAAAYGIFTLEQDELFSLNPGRARRPGNKALIAAGTGLGQAILYDDGHEYYPSASEGGHGDFAPRNETEIGLLRHLIKIFGHVSYERVVSGPGIANIYDFFKESNRSAEPAWLREKINAADDPSAIITQSALAGKPEICVKTLDLFASVYGAEAGNLALRAKATAGIYVGGGIAPKILDKLKDGTFMGAFTDKGRYAEFASEVPVQVVLNQQAPLQGAAYFAAFRSDD